MNDTKDLETLLRSWAPRRPSKRLKRRIFDRPLQAEPAAAENIEPMRRSLALAWVAPGMAALLLVSLILGQRTNLEFTTAVPSSGLMAAALSNHNAAAWLAASYSIAQNALPSETFEWTNGSGSRPAIRSFFVPSRTN